MYKLILKEQDKKIVVAQLASFPHLWLLATSKQKTCEKQAFIDNLIQLAADVNDSVFTDEISNFIGELTVYEQNEIYIEGNLDITKASYDELVSLVGDFDYEKIIGNGEVRIEHDYNADKASNTEYFNQYNKKYRKEYSIFNSVTNILIAINVVVFALNYAFGYLQSQFIVSGVHNDLIREFVSIIFAGFSHASFAHIFFNMLFLHSVGRIVEQLVGKRKFLAIYFIGLITSGYAVAYIGTTGTFTLGASGALFTLFGFFIIFVMKNSTNRQLKNDVLFNAGVNLLLTISVASISLVGHISGLIVGIVIYYVMRYFNN